MHWTWSGKQVKNNLFLTRIKCIKHSVIKGEHSGKKHFSPIFKSILHSIAESWDCLEKGQADSTEVNSSLSQISPGFYVSAVQVF